jgi:hypothetical protein
LAGLLSLFSGLLSLLVEELSLLAAAGVAVVSLLAVLLDGSLPRLSVLYQPLPLKTIAGGVSTRRASAPQVGHPCTDGASKPSRFS